MKDQVRFMIHVEQETIKEPRATNLTDKIVATGRFRILLTIIEGSGEVPVAEWEWEGPWRENVTAACTSLCKDVDADREIAYRSQFEIVREDVTESIVQFLDGWMRRN